MANPANGNQNNVVFFPTLRYQGFFDKRDVQKSMELLDRNMIHTLTPQALKNRAADYEQMASTVSYPSGRMRLFIESIFLKVVLANENRLDKTETHDLESKIQELKNRKILRDEDIEQIKQDAQQFAANATNVNATTLNLRFNKI